MIWVVGNEGMLGREVFDALKDAGFNSVGSDKDVDIRDPRAIDNFITKTEATRYLEMHKAQKHPSGRKIDWVINCAAATDLLKAEDTQGGEEAKSTNTEGALNLARAARAHGSRLIHISCANVFDGKSSLPYKESDPKNPINKLGQTLSEGEDAITSSMSQYYIIRTGLLFGVYGDNIVQKVLSGTLSTSYRGDQVVSPTSCSNLAQVIALIIERAQKATSVLGRNSALSYGVWNYTDAGTVTINDFTHKIIDLAASLNITQGKLKLADQKSAPDTLSTPLSVPRNCTLDCTKIIKELRLKVPSWEASLKEYLSDTRDKRF